MIKRKPKIFKRVGVIFSVHYMKIKSMQKFGSTDVLDKEELKTIVGGCTVTGSKCICYYKRGGETAWTMLLEGNVSASACATECDKYVANNDLEGAGYEHKIMFQWCGSLDCGSLGSGS